MTSVLYSGGLNYQIGNPVRAELASLRTSVADLRKLVDGFTVEIQNLKNDLRNLNKVVASNRSSVSVLSSQIGQLQSAVTSLAQQGNFTAPTFSTVNTATAAAPLMNSVVDDEYETDEEEVVPVPAPSPVPAPAQRVRRRRGE
jgi:chromosome segregation ATPase